MSLLEKYIRMYIPVLIFLCRVGVGIMSQLSIVALFLEMDYLRILKIAPDIK